MVAKSLFLQKNKIKGMAQLKEVKEFNELMNFVIGHA
jgi:hypothetical protein